MSDPLIHGGPAGGLERIVGHDDVVERLTRAMRLDRLHHAYLFAGAEGVGKATTALALAEAMHCRVAPGVGCDTCADCSRIVRDLHPDVLRVAAAEKSLKIEQVRTVEERVGQGPMEGRALVVLLDEAERLSTAAANALLKSLEEPRARVHFVLVTAAPLKLPITVRSRCQRVRFGPLAPSSLVLLLCRQGVSAEDARSVVRLAEGSVARAQRLLEEADLPRWQNWAGELARASTASSADPPALAGRLLQELPDPGPMLELLLLRLRDHLLLASETDGSGERLLALEESGPEADQARFDGPRTVLRKLRAVQTCMRDLESYVNKQLALEHMIGGLTTS